MSVYMQGVVALMGVNILMALSVYAIISTDQVSLGNAGFMAIGAYTSAYLTVKTGMAIFPAIVIGALVASVMGLLVGIPVLRLSGLYIVMATFGFGEVVRTFFLNFEPTGGAYGFRGPIGTTLPMIFAWVLAFIILFWLMSHSRLGRALAAVRDDPEVASSIGLNVKLLKLGAFGWAPLLRGWPEVSTPITCFILNRTASIFWYRPWPSCMSSWAECIRSGEPLSAPLFSAYCPRCCASWRTGA